jgi:holo-[acyl-carrier protein] synthase
MILGLGSDIVDIERIAAAVKRHPDRFSRRILTPLEWEAYKQRGHCVNFLAKRFAAKEAVSKALGTGLRGVIQWQTIEVLNTALGQPQVTLLQEARIQLPHNTTISITLTDERRYAVAFAVHHYVVSELG